MISTDEVCGVQQHLNYLSLFLLLIEFCVHSASPESMVSCRVQLRLAVTKTVTIHHHFLITVNF